MSSNTIEKLGREYAAHYRLGHHEYVVSNVRTSEVPALAASVALKLPSPLMVDFLKRLEAAPPMPNEAVSSPGREA